MRIRSIAITFLVTALAVTDAFTARSFVLSPRQAASASANTIRPLSFLQYKSSNFVPGNGTSLDVSVQDTAWAELEQLYASSATDATPPHSQHDEQQWPLHEKAEEAVEEKEEEGGMSDVAKARLLLLAAAALYGTNFSLVKILGETDMSVGLSSMLRFGMAALATAPWLFSVDEKDENRRWQQLFDPSSTQFMAALGGLEVGMWNSIGYIAQAIGLETTSASKSAFLCSLAVVIVPILDYLNGRTLATKQVIGVILAVIGVGFLELEGTSMASLSSGDLASLVQPLAFGLGFWKMERVMNKFPEEAARSTAGQLLAVFIGSGAYCFLNSIFVPVTIPPIDQFMTWITNPVVLFSLFWTGVVTTALTIYMETVALKTLSAAETTLIFSTEPLWGTAFASVVMGEQLGLNAALGAVMILGGCIYSNLGLQGLLRFVPGGREKAVEAIKNTTNLELDGAFEFEDEKYKLEESTFSQDRVGKLLSKTGVAGFLTGVVAAVESGAPTMIPEELKDFLETLEKMQ